mmetsp:Transcript_38857/g.96554  ORF Transcript_38857/g.96554 Transcript_38857/m.96554 type:complete len:103 (+) Transcript_38857:218-526(+)
MPVSRSGLQGMIYLPSPAREIVTRELRCCVESLRNELLLGSGGCPRLLLLSVSLKILFDREAGLVVGLPGSIPIAKELRAFTSFAQAIIGCCSSPIFEIGVK